MAALPTQLQSYIHVSRYARWLDAEGRRETWDETVNRYASFFANRFPPVNPEVIDLDTAVADGTETPA